MTALQYMGTGILFALVAGICFVGAIVYFLLTKQKYYLYTERLGRMKFPEQFYKDMKEQYEKTENISQTLDLLLDTANVITQILLKDLKKICRLSCKQEKNIGEENKNEKK